jgi:pimeloyl-ACP methyl ester carboxylesterase
VLDQRGTGLSRPSTECGATWSLPADRTTDDSATTRALLEQGRACVERLRARGVDLAAYTTTEIADDVDALRVRLGVPKVSLFGFSYGSHLALEVARRHPASVERLIIGGVEGAGQTYKLPANHTAPLARLDSIVRADPRLSRYVPDFLALVERVHARLRKAPMRVALPIRTVTRYAERGFWMRRGIDLLAFVRPRYHVLVGEHDLQALLAVGGGRMDLLRELPSLYYRMSRGDFERAALLTLVLRKTLPIGPAMGWVVDCADGVLPVRADSIASQLARTPIGAALNWPMPGVCAGWVPLPEIPPESRTPVASEVPVLVAAGTLDGRTPLEQARDVMRTLPSSRLIVVDNAAHGDVAIFNAPEIRRAVLEFLRGTSPSISRLALPPPEFEPPVSFAGDIADTLVAAGIAEGGDAVVRQYESLAAAHASDYAFDFSEAMLNAVGYRLLAAGQAEAAVRAFALNRDKFPRSLNVYDSLGEALLAADRPADAAAALRIAISLGYNPHSYRLLRRAEGAR